jgi:hypothetical protein
MFSRHPLEWTFALYAVIFVVLFIMLGTDAA